MFQVVQMITLVAVMAHVGRHGDHRDILAAFVVSGLWVAEGALMDDLPAVAGLFLGGMATFILFSVKRMGAVLGILSGCMALWAVMAWYGWIPSHHGAGIAFNYHNHIALFFYGMFFTLWKMAGERHAVTD